MVALNKATNMPELSKIMQEFAKQSEQMEMKQEVRIIRTVHSLDAQTATMSTAAAAATTAAAGFGKDCSDASMPLSLLLLLFLCQMIGDVLDDTLDDEEDEKESDMIVSQVLDELGVSLAEGLVDVPGKKQEAKQEEVKPQLDERDQALEARFNNLQGK